MGPHPPLEAVRDDAFLPVRGVARHAVGAAAPGRQPSISAEPGAGRLPQGAPRLQQGRQARRRLPSRAAGLLPPRAQGASEPQMMRSLLCALAVAAGASAQVPLAASYPNEAWKV